MTEYQFKGLYCDNLTPSADSHSECERLSTEGGWSWSKALVCPECRKKITNGTFVRPEFPNQIEMDDL